MITCKTSTLVAVNTTDQALTAGDIIALNTQEKTGCNICFNGGTSPIRFNHTGVYLVSLSATMLGAVAGDVTIQLLNNGQPVLGAQATATMVVGDKNSLAFTTVIPALCCPNSAYGTQNLQFQFLTNNATITDIIVTVVKVG